VNHGGLLAYYASPGVFTSVEGFEEQVDAIPNDVASVAAAVQGLVLHDAWAPAYGVTLAPERLAEKELHSAVAMLGRATSMDARPLTEPRQAEQRAVGVCRHFATLFVAFLRRKGVPARARCGFASYFEPGKHGDHWVSEYWNRGERRWVLVDEQLDELQRNIVKPDFDTLDVPRDRFLVAGDAWRLCRSGEADPLTFGVGGTDLWGLTEVMGDVFQDLAALQKIELLPWGWYGLAKDGDAWEGELELIDRLATLSTVADAPAVTELFDLVAADSRLAIPAERVNATRAAEVARP
jgi:hypothetical protein